MKTREIHVVHGTQGEYSDRSEWVVAAFALKEDAQSVIDRLTVFQRENPYPEFDWDGDWNDEGAVEKFMSESDAAQAAWRSKAEAICPGATASVSSGDGARFYLTTETLYEVTT